jgi:large subunit ribosomal protein L17
MLSNLATSLLDKERVTTTVAKAKEVRGVVERLITYSKRGGLHAMRLAARTVNDKTVLKKLFDEIGPGYKDREGGYTRIVKLGERRGDNAEMSIIELVGRDGDEPRKRKKKKAQAKKKPAAKKSAVSKESQPAEAPTEEASQSGAAEASPQGAEERAGAEEQSSAQDAAGSERNDNDAAASGDAQKSADGDEKAS